MTLPLTSNRARALGKMKITLTGTPGSGKTHTACSISDYWPAFIPAKEWVNLDDLLLIPFDEDAAIGLYEKRLVVPEVPLIELMREHETPAQLVNAILDSVYTYAKPGSKIIVDTADRFDKIVMRFYNDMFDSATGSGKRDSFAIERHVVATHDLFLTELFKLGLPVVICLHSKPRSQSVSSVTKNLAAAPAGRATFEPDIYYKSAVNLYRFHASLSLVCDVKQDLDGEKRYSMHSDPYANFEAKNRLTLSIPSVIENPCLSRLLTQAKQTIGDIPNE